MSDNEIIRLYVYDKLPCSKIADLTNKSEATIYKILIQNKTKLRNKSEANKIFSDKILIILYNFGLSIRQIGKLLGIHPTTISKRFNTIHFPVRSSKVAKSIGYTDQEFNHYFYNKGFINKIKKLSV